MQDSRIISLEPVYHLAQIMYQPLFAIQSIYVPADDLTDPAPVVIFGHLDGITVLSRGLASKAIYPAVDPFSSTSSRKMLDPYYVKQEHFYVATQMLQRYKELQDVIAILGLEELSNQDLLVLTELENLSSCPNHSL